MQVRPATAADLDAMVETMFAEPGADLRALVPSLDGARRFSKELWRRAGLEHFVVAADDDGGDVVGFAWWDDDDVSMMDAARAAIAGWGVLGPLRALVRSRPRLLVNLPMPPGPKLVELQVHPSRRGTGVGSVLLEHVLDAVGDAPISLTTRSDNPARRLYERHGFVVTAEKTHPRFEERTGSKGRVLMVRPGR